jgi:hypothetical protein
MSSAIAQNDPSVLRPRAVLIQSDAKADASLTPPLLDRMSSDTRYVAIAFLESPGVSKNAF